VERLVAANEVEGGKMALRGLAERVHVANCACIRIYTYLQIDDLSRGCRDSGEQ